MFGGQVISAWLRRFISTAVRTVAWPLFPVGPLLAQSLRVAFAFPRVGISAFPGIQRRLFAPTLLWGGTSLSIPLLAVPCLHRVSIEICLLPLAFASGLDISTRLSQFIFLRARTFSSPPSLVGRAPVKSLHLPISGLGSRLASQLFPSLRAFSLVDYATRAHHSTPRLLPFLLPYYPPAMTMRKLLFLLVSPLCHLVRELGDQVVIAVLACLKHLALQVFYATT